MKNIIKYCKKNLSINEYLSTNVKIHHYEKVTETILKYFGIKKFENDDKYKLIYNVIYSWCKDNNVTSENELNPMCSLETYNDLTIINSKDFNKIKRNFNTSYTGNEICQEELSKVHVTNKVKINDFLDIWYTENMIACLCMVGTIYCWNKEVMDGTKKLV